MVTGNEPAFHNPPTLPNTKTAKQPKKGSKLAEITMEYKKISIFYGGRDKKEEETFLILSEGPVLTVKESKPTAEECRKAFAEHYGKDIYMVETSAGRIFYEACNDMSEKKGLYKELGASVTVEYRHGKKPSAGRKMKDAYRF